MIWTQFFDFMIVIETQYFPSLEFFSLIKNENEILIDGYENFVKQTFRNRCYILSANKVLPLSVPLVGVNKKIKTKDIKIDYVQKWQNQHWRAIMSSYNKSPYFEYYSDLIHDIIYTNHTFMIDLNHEILTFCQYALQLDLKINYSENYISNENGTMADIRSIIHPKKPFSDRKYHSPVPYRQTFGSKFASNLSIIDLIFCMGPESQKYY